MPQPIWTDQAGRWRMENRANLVRRLQGLATRMQTEHAMLVESFRGSRAEPLVLHYVQSMVLQRRDGEPRMTPFATMGLAEFHPEGTDLRDDSAAFLSKLTFAIQWGQYSRFAAVPSTSVGIGTAG